MKLEWLVIDVTAAGSPDRAEHTSVGLILAGRFFGQFRPYLWSVELSDRAGRAILRGILTVRFFGQFRPYL